MTKADTRQKILDSAEVLFAEHGFGEVSVRQVVQAAEVNVASIHYYFGSKDALIEEVLSRRLAPLNEERLRLLTEFESAAEKESGVLSLEDVLYALIGPAIRLSRENDGGGYFIRLVGRLFAEPSESVQTMLKSRFKELFIRFNGALTATLPKVKKRDLFWRMHFVLGAMSLTLCDRNRPAVWSEGVCDPEDLEEVIAQLVTFCAAGMRADACKKRRKR